MVGDRRAGYGLGTSAGGGTEGRGTGDRIGGRDNGWGEVLGIEVLRELGTE